MIALALVTLGAAGFDALFPQVESPDSSAADETDLGLAFVEALAERNEAFTGQRVAVRIRFGIERSFADEGMVPMFRRELDLSVRLDAPWIDRVRIPQGLRPIAIALNGTPSEVGAAGTTNRDGRTYRTFELVAYLRPDRPGKRALTGPRLSYARAASFREDALRGRVAESPRIAFVTGPPVTLRVRPLPEDGRPPTFGGLVGHLSADVTAAPRDLAFGGTLRMRVRVFGDADLDRLEVAPRLERSEDFVQVGLLTEPGSEERTFVYDLKPLRAGSLPLPRFRLPYFDPSARRYATLEPPPKTVLVRPPDTPTEEAPPVAHPPPFRSEFFLAASGLGLLLVAWLAIRRRR